MKWFGESWGAPVNESPQIPTPVGKLCDGGCGREIKGRDKGIALPWTGPPIEGQTINIDGLAHFVYHLDCFTKTMLGLQGSRLDQLKQKMRDLVSDDDDGEVIVLS